MVYLLSLQVFKRIQMAEKICAPILDNLLNRAKGQPIVVNPHTKKVLMQIVEEMKVLEICGDDECRMLWFHVERGDIEAFGDYDELLEEGEISNRKEFEEWWLGEYPEPVSWYRLTVRHYDNNYYFYINQDLLFHIPDKSSKNYEADHSQLLEWLIDEINKCIEWLRKDEAGYNDFLSKNLSYSKRIGRIKREDYWKIFPEDKEWMLKELTEDDINILCKVVDLSEADNKPAYQTMPSGMFFECCKMGYNANSYCKDNETLSAIEMYKKFADGRHDGLLDLDHNSTEAFEKWLRKGSRGGHPWEVCRGGNSTHISLFVYHTDNGWRLDLAGSSAGRVAETVRFAIALYKNNIHFDLRQAQEILLMVTGKDYIGIVPQGIFPRYCHSLFPKEDKIIDFMNLGYEYKDEIIMASYWYPLNPIKLY